MSERINPDRITKRQLIGRLGEDAVASHYASKGYTILERNVHLSHNEIDLIVKNETHLVFIEVKTRHMLPGSKSRYGRPAGAVDQAKRTRTVVAAQTYLRLHRDTLPPNLQPRIDLVEVYVKRCADGTDQIADVKVFRNAFGAR